MNKLKTWIGSIAIATTVSVGAYAVTSFANDGNTSPVTEPTSSVESTPEVTISEPTLEPITFEYYTITEEAVSNGWTCGTIYRCDKNVIMVYLYNPSEIAQQKINVVTGFDASQLDLHVVYVDQYNNVLGTEVFTLVDRGSHRDFPKVFDNLPPGTAYVKFADVTNVVKIEE